MVVQLPCIELIKNLTEDERSEEESEVGVVIVLALQLTSLGVGFDVVEGMVEAVT